MQSRLSRFSSCVVLLGIMAVLAGCGPDYKARGVVKGKVTFNKQKLTSGTVMFYGPSGSITSSTVIDTEGNYVMNDAPLGEVQITVTVGSLPPAMTMKYGPGRATKEGESKDPTGGISDSIPIMSKMPSKLIRIDDKYSKPDTSGLKYTVEKGEHTYDIEL